MVEYATRHLGLAAFLRYCLGDESHVRTEQRGNERGCWFIFDDSEGQCAELAAQFFAGAGVSNCKEFCDVEREVRLSSRDAYVNGGVLRRN